MHGVYNQLMSCSGSYTGQVRSRYLTIWVCYCHAARRSSGTTHSWISTGRTGASTVRRERAPEQPKLPWMSPRLSDASGKFRTRSQLLAQRKIDQGKPSVDPGEFTSKNPPPIGLGYVDKPRFRTRSELLKHRRQRMLPPLAYGMLSRQYRGALQSMSC